MAPAATSCKNMSLVSFFSLRDLPVALFSGYECFSCGFISLWKFLASDSPIALFTFSFGIFSYFKVLCHVFLSNAARLHCIHCMVGFIVSSRFCVSESFRLVPDAVHKFVLQPCHLPQQRLVGCTWRCESIAEERTPDTARTGCPLR